MNLRDLEYFKYLAESLSFTKTAEHFFVSQPSISIALKRLEEEFATTLIQRERSAKNIHLTPSGRILYQRTIDMLSLFAQTKQEVKQYSIDTIQLGLVPIISNYFLPKLFKNANEYIHSLKLVEEQKTEDLFETLRAKAIPTAILAHKEEHLSQKWLETQPIFSGPIKLCVSKNHPLARFRSLTFNELKNESFICMKDGTLHEELFNEWATTNGLSLKNVMYTDDMTTLATLVETGSRIALLIDSITLNRDEIVTVNIENAPMVYISLVINTEVERSAEQKAFDEHLIQNAKSIYHHHL